MTCNYDYIGRRFQKKLTVNGIIISHTCYLYRDYLQVAEVDLMFPIPMLKKSYLWDPTEPTATDILMMTCWNENEMEGKEHFYFMHDAVKNVSTLFDDQQIQRAHYVYAPFGDLFIMHGDMGKNNKFRFSCEYADDELGLIYFNYRHLNPLDGRWINRDPIQEESGLNLYDFIKNASIYRIDYLGLKDWECDKQHLGWYDGLKFELTNIVAGESYTVADPESLLLDAFKEKLKDGLKDGILEKIDPHGIIKETEEAVKENLLFRIAGVVAQNLRTNAYVLEETKLHVSVEYCCCKKDKNGKLKYYMNPVSHPDSFKWIFDIRKPTRFLLKGYFSRLKEMMKKSARNIKLKACKENKNGK